MTTSLRRAWWPVTASLLTSLALPQSSVCDDGVLKEAVGSDDPATSPTFLGLCNGLVNSHGNLPVGVSIEPSFADFNGDQRLDAFLSIAGKPVLSVSPGAIDMNFAWTPPAPLPTITATAALELDDGELPVMLASTNSGLQLWWLDGSEDHLGTSLVSSPSWSDASQLFAANLDGQAGPEVLGVFNRGLTSTEFRVGRLDRNGTLVEVASQTFAIPMPAVGLVDWTTSDSGAEISVAFQQRVYILNDQLAVLNFELLGEPIVDAATIVDDSGPGLAVVTTSAGSDSLVVLRPGSSEPFVSLGPIGTTQVICADGAVFDPGDLLLRCVSGVRGLANRSRVAAQAFDGVLDSASFNVNDGTVLYECSSWIAAADLDNDDDADLFLHQDAMKSVLVAKSLARGEAALMPRIWSLGFTDIVSVSTSPDVNNVTFDLHRIAVLGLQTGATHLQVEVWDLLNEAEVNVFTIPMSSAVNDTLAVSYDINYENALTSSTMVLARAIIPGSGAGEILWAGPDLCLSVPAFIPETPGGTEPGIAPSSTDPDPPARNTGNGPPTPSGG